MIADNRSDVRRFEAEIASALQSFEKAREWADLSNCLNRLQKVLSRYPISITLIPSNDLIAKRLGQCLHSTLPAGVHVKCLEVYSEIFEKMELDDLSRDLGLWSAGLFPVFQDCATHIKPLFLNIIDKFYLPLEKRILPCLTGLLVCLLPGLENAADPYHDRLVELLETIGHRCVGIQEFMAALWVVILRTPRIRLPALQLFYVLLGPIVLADLPEDQIATFLPEKGTLVLGAFERLFEDPNVLVQRQVLDLLVTHLPLSSNIYTCTQKVRLLSSSLRVLSAGEWSLTRRFLNWITNQADMLNVVDLAYFRTQVRDELCDALKLKFHEAMHSKANNGSRENLFFPLKVIRVISSEAEELAPLLLSRLAIEILSSAYYATPTVKPAVLELIKPLLAGQEGTAVTSIWTALDEALEQTTSADQNKEDLLQPLNLSLFFLQEVLESTAKSELSRVAAQGLKALSFTIHKLVASPTETHYQKSIQRLLRFTLHCFRQLEDSQDDMTATSAYFNSQALVNVPVNFFQDVESIMRGLPESLFLLSGDGTRRCSVGLSSVSLDSSASFSNNDKVPTIMHETELPETLSKVLLILLNLKPYKDLLASRQHPPEWLCLLSKFILSSNYYDMEWTCARIFLSVLEGVPFLAEYYISTAPETVKVLASQLWQHVIDSNLASQSAMLLLKLHRLESCVTRQTGVIVQTLLVSDLTHHGYDYRLGGFQRFAIIWQLSHTFYPDSRIFAGAMGLILDCLDAPEPSLRHMCCSWLTSALSEQLPHVMDPLFEDLLSTDIQRTTLSLSTFSHDKYTSFHRDYIQLYDTARTSFVMSRLTSIARTEPKALVAAAQLRQVTPSILQANWSQSSFGYQEEETAEEEEEEENEKEQEKGINDNTNEDESSKDQTGQHQQSINNVGSSDVIMEMNKKHQTLYRPKRVTIMINPSFKGYTDDRCVVDYLDLFCVTALRFILTTTSAEFGGEFERLNLIVQCASAEFLRIFLTSGSAYLSPLRRAEVYRLLASPLLQFFTTEETSTLHIQCLDVLRLILPSVLKALPIIPQQQQQQQQQQSTLQPYDKIDVHISDASTVIDNASRMSSEFTSPNTLNKSEYIRVLEAKVIAIKQYQLERLETSVLLSRDILPATLCMLNSCALSDKYLRIAVLYSSTLSRLIEFPLYLCQLIPENHAEFPFVTNAILLRFLTLLRHGTTSLVSCYHLLKGMISLVLMLAKTKKQPNYSTHTLNDDDDDDHDMQDGTQAVGFWSALFGGLGSSSNTATESEQALYSKRSHQAVPSSLWGVFRINLPNVLYSIDLALNTLFDVLNHTTDHFENLDSAQHSGNLANIYDNNNMTLFYNKGHQLEDFSHIMSLNTAPNNINAMHEKHKQDHSILAVNGVLIQSEIYAFITALFESAPQELLLSLLYLEGNFTKSTNLIIQALAVSTSVSCVSIIVSLTQMLEKTFKVSTTSGSKPNVGNQSLSAQCFEQQQEQHKEEDLKLPTRYVPQTTKVLALFDAFLEAYKSRLIETGGPEEWPAVAKTLTLTLTEAVQPIELLWILAILQRLDFYKPSRESFFGANVKKLLRDVQDLGNSISLIAAQSFHLQKHATFNMSSSIPPLYEAELRNTLPPEAPLFIRCPNKTSDKFEYSLEVDSVTAAAQIALICIISISRQVIHTQKRSLVAGALVQQFSGLCGRPILLATMKTSAMEHLQYRYLGLLCVQSLPIDLVPSAILPAKQIFAGFMQSPAFGVPSGIFAQASPGANTGVVLFRGFDRRCLRSLAVSVRRACENEPDQSTLIDSLIISRPVGVFTSKETELWRKARELKRLSLVIYSCRKDFFLFKVSSIIERVLESLKSENPNVLPQTRLHEQAFLCLRVLLYRFSSHALAAIWPIVLTEATRICAQPSAEYNLILAVLKLIDFAVLLDIPEFHLHEWIFITDSLASATVATSNILSESNEDVSKAIFEPLCGRLGRDWSRDTDIELESKRSPLLLQHRVATTWQEVCEAAGKLNGLALPSTIAGTAINVETVKQSIEDDLLECQDWLLDWAPMVQLNMMP